MKFNRTSLLLTSLASLLVGLLTDYLFTDKIFGLNFLLWIVAWVSFALAIAHMNKKSLFRPFAYSAFALLNATMVFIRVEPIVQFWSVSIALVSITNLLAYVHITNFSAISITQRMTQFAISFFRTLGSFGLLSENSKQTMKTPWRWVASISLVILFIGLFSSSDRVFGSGFSWLSSIFTTLQTWLEGLDFPRLISLIFWSGISLMAAIMLLKPQISVAVHNVALAKIASAKDRLVILVPLVIVFAAYGVVQVVFLFGSTALPDGISYAEYAREGYGELLLATAIASSVVYITHRMSTIKNVAADSLSLVLLGLNVVVVASAWKRLSLYEDAYGWTMTRFVARLGLVCIAMGIAVLALYIFNKLSSAQFFSANWYSLAIVLTIAAALNPVGLVTSYNMNNLNAREVPLDTVHLLGQSPDSYLAICKNLENVKVAYPDKYQQIINRQAVGSRTVSEYEYFEDEKMPLDNKSNSGVSRHWVYTENFKEQASSCSN